MIQPHDDEKPTEAQQWTQLLLRAQKGDHASFGELVEQAEQSIYTYAYRIILDENLAWDIMQDTFCKVWALRGDYSPQLANAKTWIYKIAYSVAVDHYRRQKRRGQTTVSLSGSGKRNDPTDPIELRDRSARDPSELADVPQVTALVRDALQQLSFEDREALRLCHIDELSYEEIAKILNCSVKAVGPRLTRAREKFRKIYGPDALP